ncbi:MAG: hypothetical protein JW807_16970 [Spirochaetes bacterium]|nr:hypothetical protein [Spirochaetota bacterium]
MGRRVEIRSMTIDDLRAVFLLGSRLYGNEIPESPGGWSEKNLADILSENLENSFVAVQKKEIVGFLIGGIEFPDSERGYARIFWLGTDENCSATAAESLMETFITGLPAAGVARISIELHDPDKELITLTKKFGFTESKHVLIMENFLSKRDK